MGMIMLVRMGTGIMGRSSGKRFVVVMRDAFMNGRSCGYLNFRKGWCSMYNTLFQNARWNMEFNLNMICVLLGIFKHISGSIQWYGNHQHGRSGTISTQVSAYGMHKSKELHTKFLTQSKSRVLATSLTVFCVVWYIPEGDSLVISLEVITTNTVQFNLNLTPKQTSYPTSIVMGCCWIMALNNTNCSISIVKRLLQWVS